MTLLVFALVRVVPRIAARIGEVRMLAGGLAIALVGMLWLGQITGTTSFLPGMACRSS